MLNNQFGYLYIRFQEAYEKYKSCKSQHTLSGLSIENGSTLTYPDLTSGESYKRLILTSTP